MKLENLTPHAALLLKNGSIRDDRMMGCVIVRVLFDVDAAGALSPSKDRWPLGVEPVETPLGRMPGDKPFYLGGVDVLLGGRVFQPEGLPEGRLEVEVEVGRTFRKRFLVIGDRKWLRTEAGELVPTAPAPFLSMALRYGLAFGGQAKNETGQPVPYSPNPDGRGYYLDEASAVGQPLPNLEQPGALVARFDDRPVPVGLGYYPETGSLRPIAAINHPAASGARSQIFGKGPVVPGPPVTPPAPLDSEITADHLTPALFNQAHPDMVIEARKSPLPGDAVRLSRGRRGGEDLAFVLPETPAHVHVQLADREALVPLHLDQIGILGGEDRVLLSYRTVFEYRVVAREKRFATLHPGPLPAEIPARYRKHAPPEWDGGFGEAGFSDAKVE